MFVDVFCVCCVDWFVFGDDDVDVCCCVWVFVYLCCCVVLFVVIVLCV